MELEGRGREVERVGRGNVLVNHHAIRSTNVSIKETKMASRAPYQRVQT